MIGRNKVKQKKNYGNKVLIKAHWPHFSPFPKHLYYELMKLIPAILLSYGLLLVSYCIIWVFFNRNCYGAYSLPISKEKQPKNVMVFTCTFLIKIEMGQIL